MDSENIELQLGDIIRLHSPSNKDYDKKIFFIDYIDSDVIVVVNDAEKYELTREDGVLTDESIEENQSLNTKKRVMPCAVWSVCNR